ncbi:MAG TPA: SRPBCC family protein [Candidatus Binatus sp.]|nr:SRPBCC family protein [Candidatus Binatus sp.]
MFEFSTDLDVRCTAAQAFDHVARGFFEHHGLWDPTVISMRKTSDGPVGVGTTGIEERRFGRSRQKAAFKVTEFEPDRRFAWESTSGPAHQQADLTIEERPGGARVHVHVRLTPASLGARLTMPLMRSMLDRNLRAHTEGMRKALDAEAAASMPRDESLPT